MFHVSSCSSGPVDIYYIFQNYIALAKQSSECSSWLTIRRFRVQFQLVGIIMEDNNKSTVTEKPSTSNTTNIIVLTPDECTKLGLFKQVQVAIKDSPSSSQETDRPTIPNKSKTDGNKRDTLDEFGKKLAKALREKINRTEANKNFKPFSKREKSPVLLHKYMSYTNRPKATIKSIKTTHNKSIDSPELITLDDGKDISSSSSKEPYLTSKSLLLPNAESVFKSTREPLNNTIIKKERVNVISSKSLNLSNNELKNLLATSKPRNITHQPFLIPKEETVLEDANFTASIVSSHLIKPENNDLNHAIQSKAITQTNKTFANLSNIKKPQRSEQETTDIEIISVEETQDEVVIALNTKNRFNERNKEDNHEFADNEEDHDIIEIKPVTEQHGNKKDTDVQPPKETQNCVNTSYQKMREKLSNILKSETQQSSSYIKKNKNIQNQPIVDLVKSHVNKVNTFKCYGKNKNITKTYEGTEPMMRTPIEKPSIKKTCVQKRKQNLDTDIVAKKLKVKKSVVKVVETELTEDPRQVEDKSSAVSIASNFDSEIKKLKSNKLRKNEFKVNGKDQSSFTAFIPDSGVVGQLEKSESSSLDEKATKQKDNASVTTIVIERKPETILFSKESTISLVEDIEPSFEIETHAKLETSALNEIEHERNSRDQISVTILDQSCEVETQKKKRKTKPLSKEDISSVDSLVSSPEINTNHGKLESPKTDSKNQCSVSSLVSSSDIEKYTLREKESEQNDQCSIITEVQGFIVEAQAFRKEETMSSVSDLEPSTEINSEHRKLGTSALKAIDLQRNSYDQFSISTLVSSSDINAGHKNLENEMEPNENNEKDQCSITTIVQNIKVEAQVKKPKTKLFSKEVTISAVNDLVLCSEINTNHGKLESSALKEIDLQQNINDQSSVSSLVSSSDIYTDENLESDTLREKDPKENNEKDRCLITTVVQNFELDAQMKKPKTKSFSKEDPLSSVNNLESSFEIDTPEKLEISSLENIKLEQNGKDQYSVTELVSSSDIDAKHENLENNTSNEQELVENCKKEKSLITINDSEVLTHDKLDWEDEPLINLISKPVNKTVDEPEKKKKQRGRPRKIPIVPVELPLEPKGSDTSKHSHLKRGRKNINYNENNKELDDLIKKKGTFTSSHHISKTSKKRGRPRNNPLPSSDIDAEHKNLESNTLREKDPKENNKKDQCSLTTIAQDFKAEALLKNPKTKSFSKEDTLSSVNNLELSFEIDTPEKFEVSALEEIKLEHGKDQSSVTELVSSSHIDAKHENLENNTSNEQEPVEKTVDEAEKKRKQRGRPRKIPIVTVESSIERKDSDTSNQSHLKRVRKSINYNENNDKELDDLIKQKGILTSSRNISTNATSKKRGRPRNNPSPQPPEDLSSNPTPKKVGTPKKNSNEVTITQNYSSDSEDELQIESSIYGRKRKKVNYMLMDNPEKEKRRRKSFLVDSNVSEGGCSDASSNDKEKAEISSTVSDGKEDNKANDSNCIYRHTGATTKMLSTMLSTSIETDDVDIGSGPKVSLQSVPKRGRPRFHRPPDHDQNIQYNSDGTVLCMICNQNINDTEWQYHKMKIHYNLAWRSGELPLDIHDENFVYKNFKHLKKRNGKLKCHKCRAKHTDVRKFMDHLEICNGIVSSDGCVTCALCREVLDKSQWQFHKLRYHNNLTWREGEKPLNLNDQTLVMAILNNIYKYRKPLHCEKCGVAKKSVVGYLSHKSICQKTEEELEQLKVTCELCGNKLMPVSLESHNKLAHSKKIEPVLDPNDLKVDSDAPTGKRKAAKKAMDIIDVFKTDGKVAMEVHNKYYIPQINFKEETFVSAILRTQMAEYGVKCKFKNCDYTDPSVKDLVEHMSECEHKPPEYYCCRRCLLVSETELEMKEHFTERHDITVEFDEDFVASDEEEDEVLEANAKILRGKMTNQKERHDKDTSYKITPRCILQIARRNFNRIFEYAYIWTKEFCDEHYFKVKLLDKLFGIDPNWQIIDDELLDSYLPSVHRSCDVACKTIKQGDNLENMDYEFKNLELFETATNSNGNTSTLFCGGPISSLAWLPTPYTQLDCDQVLAVSVLKNSHKHYNIHDNYPEPSLIQFWNFGTLRNKDKLGLATAPKLMFSLAHNYGPVWHMEWCPSGFHQVLGEEKRNGTLGVLAVAGSTPAVPLFVVNRICDQGLFYTAKPVLELELETENDSTLAKQKYYPTKMSWSKASGHQYVAVGYSNGVVAIYNIATQSILLRKDKDGQMKLFPQKVFQAHISYITGLSLSHLDGGNRWLMTASFDRESIIWNLLNMTKVSRSSKKTVLSDGVWMQNWLSCILSQCETDVGLLDSIPTSAKFIRNFLSESVHLVLTSSTIKCVSTSDWLNAIIQVSSSGDVVAMFSHQLLTKIAGDKTLRHNRRLFGKTMLVEKPAFKEAVSEYSTSNPEYQKTAVTYEEAAEKYSLLFLDYNLDDNEFFPRSVSAGEFSGNGGKLSVFKHDEYSLQSINKVAFNPNLQSSTYYATGYEAGFVRITHMRYLRHSQQIV